MLSKIKNDYKFLSIIRSKVLANSMCKYFS